MVALVILICGLCLLGLLYRWFYWPTHTEKNAALGVRLTEDGLENRVVRRIVRGYRSVMKGLFVFSSFLFLAAAVCAYFHREVGIVAGVCVALFTWQIFFYFFQKYHRRMICLKFSKRWFDDSTKRVCHIKEYIGICQKEIANDLVFVPVFLLPFVAFSYPHVKEYLQGNIGHGMFFLFPFIILLLLLALYYSGVMDRTLVFLFACIEEIATLAYQWKILVEQKNIVLIFVMYLLLLLVGIAALYPYIRGLFADKDLLEIGFPWTLPTEGEENWLYGYYRNQKEKVIIGKRMPGWGISLNHAQFGIKFFLISLQILVYSGIAYMIFRLF